MPSLLLRLRLLTTSSLTSYATRFSIMHGLSFIYEEDIDICQLPTGAPTTIDSCTHGHYERTYYAIGTCYAYFMSNIEKHANLMADSQNFILCKNDLRRLHDISDPEVTGIARELWYDAWEYNSEGVIIQHIKDVYIDPWNH